MFFGKLCLHSLCPHLHKRLLQLSGKLLRDFKRCSFFVIFLNFPRNSYDPPSQALLISIWVLYLIGCKSHQYLSRLVMQLLFWALVILSIATPSSPSERRAFREWAEPPSQSEAVVNFIARHSIGLSRFARNPACALGRVR